MKLQIFNQENITSQSTSTLKINYTNCFSYCLHSLTMGIMLKFGTMALTKLNSKLITFVKIDFLYAD